LQNHFTINSPINTTELKTVPTISTTNTGIKLEKENAINMSPTASLNLPPPLKKLDPAVLSKDFAANWLPNIVSLGC
jgi:hypothetical protein